MEDCLNWLMELVWLFMYSLSVSVRHGWRIASSHLFGPIHECFSPSSARSLALVELIIIGKYCDDS